MRVIPGLDWQNCSRRPKISSQRVSAVNSSLAAIAAAGSKIASSIESINPSNIFVLLGK
jgi:hypothetical protein